MRFLVEIEGRATGGVLQLDIVHAGRASTLVVPTRAGDRLRHITERALEQLAAQSWSAALDFNYSGPAMLFGGAADLYVSTTDAGLSVKESDVPDDHGLGPMTMGVRGAAGAPPPSTGMLPSDAAVLGHLGHMVSGLAQAHRAEADLMHSIASAQKTFVQATRALLTGTAIPPELNPGPGGPIVTDQGTALQLVNGLGENTANMLSAAASVNASSARSLNEVTGKEGEAKGGGGSPASGGTGGGGKPAPGGGGTTGSPSPTGGGGSPTTGAPGNTGGPGTTSPGNTAVIQNLTTGGPPREAKLPCEIWTYYIDGLEITIGKIDGKWYMSRGQYTGRVINDDGSSQIVPNTEDFGEEGDGDEGDPDLKAKLDALVAQRQAEAAQAPEEDPWASTKSIASLLVGFTPILGDIKSLVDGVVGKDTFTDEELSPGERVLAVSTALFSLFTLGIGGEAARATGTAAREMENIKNAAQSGRLAGRELAEAERAVEGELNALRRSRNLTKDRLPTKMLDRCEAGLCKEGTQGRLIPPTGCVAAGTGISVPDVGLVPVERLETGTPVHSLLGADASSSDQAPVVARRILRTSARRVSRTFMLRLSSADGDVTLQLSPEHLVATAGGWLPASALVPGVEVIRSFGRRARVRAIDEDAAPRFVYNMAVAVDHAYFVTPLQLLVHNGPPCPGRWSRKAYEEALEHLGVEEGQVGRFETTNRQTLEFNKVGKFHPPKYALTAHHIPQDSILEEIAREAGLPKLNRSTGGTVIMTIEDHILTGTFGKKGMATKAAYLAKLEGGGITRARRVFQEALRADLLDLREVGRQQGKDFTSAISALIDYYQNGEFAPLMKGWAGLE